MIGACDKNEADEDRPLAPPPSNSPPAPPLPVVPLASPLRALASPPTMAIVSSGPPSTPPASPPPSASKKDGEPMVEEGDAAAAALPQAEAGLRLPVKNRCSLRDGAAATLSPTNCTRATKDSPHLLHHIRPAADTQVHVAVQDGFAGLYLLDGQRQRVLMDVPHDDGDKGVRIRQSRIATDQGGLALHSPPDIVPMAMVAHTLIPPSTPSASASKEEQNNLKKEDAQAGLCLPEHTREVQQAAGLAPVGVEQANRGEIRASCKQKPGEGSINRGTTVKDKQSSSVRNVQLRVAKDDQELVEQYATHPRDDITAENQEKVTKKVEQCACDADHQEAVHSNTLEPIQIRITEKVDVEKIGMNVNSTNVCGKTMVLFPPELDRHVMFLVDKMVPVDFTACALADRELFKQIPVLMSEGFHEQFELLKWHKKNGCFPNPLKVITLVADNQNTKENMKDHTMLSVEIGCNPTGVTKIGNVVVTLPLPCVDHTGTTRTIKTRVWKNNGTYSEKDNSIEWQISLVGVPNRRFDLNVDVRCYDGWQEPSQFYPIKIDFSYEDSICSKVARVVGTRDGHNVEFVQETVGHGRYIIHHPEEQARRAAAAANEEVAWQLNPWGDEDEW